jgi:hypothetical protein
MYQYGPAAGKYNVKYLHQDQMGFVIRYEPEVEIPLEFAAQLCLRESWIYVTSKHNPRRKDHVNQLI